MLAGPQEVAYAIREGRLRGAWLRRMLPARLLLFLRLRHSLLEVSIPRLAITCHAKRRRDRLTIGIRCGTALQPETATRMIIYRWSASIGGRCTPAALRLASQGARAPASTPCRHARAWPVAFTKGANRLDGPDSPAPAGADAWRGAPRQ